MKYTSQIFIVLLILVHPIQGNSQNAITPVQTKIDSTRQLLDELKVENRERVRLLNEYAQLSFNNDEFQNGFEAMHSGRELSKKINFNDGEILYYLSLSVFYKNRIEEMSTYYRKKAQWLSKRVEEDLYAYYTYLDLPYQFTERDYNDIAKELTKTLTQTEKYGDDEIQASILLLLASINADLGNIKEAEKFSEITINLFSKLDEVYPVFLISGYRMNDLISQGRADEAKIIELDLIESIASEKGQNTLGLITNSMGNYYRDQGRWALAMEYYLKSLEILDPVSDKELIGITHFRVAIGYESLEMYSKAEDSYRKSISVMASLKNLTNLNAGYMAIAFPLIALGRYEEAENYMDLYMNDTVPKSIFALGRYNDAQGQIRMKQGRYLEAIPYFQKAFDYFQKDNQNWAAPFVKLSLAACNFKMGNLNDALEHAQTCLEMENAVQLGNTVVKSKVTLLLSEIYEQLGNQSLAFKYLKSHQQMRTESEKLDEANRVADAEIRALLDDTERTIAQLEKEKSEKEQEGRLQRLWLIAIAGALISAIVLTIILYRNNQIRSKANNLLKAQKKEIESTLARLKSTQSQLIQSEKMASLGELTAGIAHEIQNPLNFVNNFSEVNKELMDELLEELLKGDYEEAKAIAQDIMDNDAKIMHHGKRAEGIVKGMLQHSRTSSGEKELTDINQLADEYLRLSYHGLRAKDKSFNADFELELDKSLPKVNVIPQDIGRVLLNLVNNAFYAVSDVEKPKVIVKTEASPLTKGGERGVVITVSDNGSGIPEQVRDKIFQPFFTTKATGEGTGLGLSMSYDIVTKGHGGELKVVTKVGKGSKFIIKLNIS